MPRNTGISSIVKEIIASNPCLAEALTEGYVNYTRLATRLATLIREEYSTYCTPNSVKMALLRLKPGASISLPRSRILSVLAKSSIELKTGLAIATYDYTALPRVFKGISELASKTRFVSLAQGIGSITIIVDVDLIEMLEKIIESEPIWARKDVVAIIIVSPVENIETPGFISYITTLLARRGINILQAMSAYSDTIIVVDRKDAIEAFKAIETTISKARKEYPGKTA